MSNLQDTTSSGSTFRDDKDDVDVVDQMYDALVSVGTLSIKGLEGGANSGEGSGGAEDREVVIVALAGVGGVIEATIGTDMGEGGWSIDEHPSTMTQQKLDQLREKYVIPSSVRLRRLIGNEKLSTPLLGWVTLCADMLKQEVWLTLSPFLVEWMSRLNVALHQMNLNV
ncbi:hypothetical protein GBA52_024222 [Prunus armeniaca]|nr:hypothetical protein GBA52_024222 [Prunus armeniaca]